MDASLKRSTASADDSCGSRGLDPRQIFFTILQLLGFDGAAMEMKYRIPFNKDMFNLPNKVGSEAVLYFLFNRLNPALCRQEFRDCWPIIDKKSETLFRRICCIWLQNIQKDEPDSNLPRISASLFLSPGGDKFCQFIFSFSVYVLRHVMRTETGIKEDDLLRRPLVTPQNRDLYPAILKTVQCASIRQRKQFLNTLQVLNATKGEWRKYSEEATKEVRLLIKRVNDLQYIKQEEMRKLSEKMSFLGSPKPTLRMSAGSDFDVNACAAECAQRVQQVRKMWKSVENFIENTAEQREIVSSVLSRSQQRYIVDAAEIKVSVPHLLLKECEQDIKRRRVNNLYEGGQLNLVSLVHLWNQALIMYINCLRKVGLRDLSNEATHLKAQKNSLQAYMSNATSLRESVSKEVPRRKQIIAGLRRQHHKGTQPSQGLNLQAPSPPMAFDPPAGQSGTTPTERVLGLTPDSEDTPEAAMNLAKAISTSSRKNLAKQFQTTAFGLGIQNASSNNSNSLSQPEKRPQRESGVPAAKYSSRQVNRECKAQTAPQSKFNRPNQTEATKIQPRVIRHVSRQRLTGDLPAKHKAVSKTSSSSSKQQQQPLASTPRESTNGAQTSLPLTAEAKNENAHSILVEKVVSAVMQDEKGQIDRLLDPVLLSTFSSSIVREELTCQNRAAAAWSQSRLRASPSQDSSTTPTGKLSDFSTDLKSRQAKQHVPPEQPSLNSGADSETDMADWNVENPTAAFEQNAFIKHDLIHRSPLEQDIRHMWQDMIADVERVGSQHRSQRLMRNTSSKGDPSDEMTPHAVPRSSAQRDFASPANTSRPHSQSPAHSLTFIGELSNSVKESEEDDVTPVSSFLAVGVKERQIRTAADKNADDMLLGDTPIGGGMLFSTSFDEDFIEGVTCAHQVDTWEERTSALYEGAEDIISDEVPEDKDEDLKSFDAAVADLLPSNSSKSAGSEDLLPGDSLTDSIKLNSAPVIATGGQFHGETDTTFIKDMDIANFPRPETGSRANLAPRTDQLPEESDTKSCSSLSTEKHFKVQINSEQNHLVDGQTDHQVRKETAQTVDLSASTAENTSKLKPPHRQVQDLQARGSAARKVNVSPRTSSSPPSAREETSWLDGLPDDGSNRMSGLWALDDSFTPLQSGLFVEGKSPRRHQPQTNAADTGDTFFTLSADADDEDLMAHVNRLRQMAAQALQRCPDIDTGKREEKDAVHERAEAVLQTTEHHTNAGHYSVSDPLDIFDQDDSVLLPLSPL